MAHELINPSGLPVPESHRPEYLREISAARIAVFGDHKPADTIVGVERLAEDGRLIEVEAIAVTG